MVRTMTNSKQLYMHTRTDAIVNTTYLKKTTTNQHIYPTILYKKNPKKPFQDYQNSI